MKINDPCRLSGSSASWRVVRTIAGAAVVLTGLLTRAHAQGTMTITFEGAPRGSIQDVGTYSESGLYFGAAPGNVFLCGGGVSGYPENGTGYLLVPDFNLVFFFPGSAGPSRYFNFLSFDAAEYAGGPFTMQVVGDRGMNGMVTNSFSLTSTNFQTFNLNPSFMGVDTVYVYGARFALDNVVLGGVPEPSSCALASVGAVWWAIRRKMRGRRTR